VVVPRIISTECKETCVIFLGRGRAMVRLTIWGTKRTMLEAANFSMKLKTAQEQ
jgi:hypothetical protein